MKWTAKEIEFLKENYSLFGSKYCAYKLKRTRQTVRLRAARLNLFYSPKNGKMCSKCFIKKDISEFSPHSKGRLGCNPKCKKCRAKSESLRKRTDKDYRLLHRVRNRIRIAIKKNVKHGKSLELLGCSITFLKEYISKKFQIGMSWKNYGKWHLDHIKPCSSFNFSDSRQQKECFHYSNLQPLWAKDNLIKSDK